MYRAFLVKADLRGALLHNTIFVEANLQQANLKNANLQGAIPVDTNLQKANLSGVSLQQSYLEGANLQQANLERANLQQVNITGVNLQRADLKRANLKNSDLRYSDLTGALNLTIEQLSKVTSLYKVKLDPELLDQGHFFLWSLAVILVGISLIEVFIHLEE